MGVHPNRGETGTCATTNTPVTSGEMRPACILSSLQCCFVFLIHTPSHKLTRKKLEAASAPLSRMWHTWGFEFFFFKFKSNSFHIHRV